MADAAETLKEKELGNEGFGVFATAHQHYDRAIQLDPTNVALLIKKAIYLEEGKSEECIKLCEQAVELGREHHSDSKQMAKAYARIGNAYFTQGRLEEALQNFNKSISEYNDPQIVRIRQEVDEKIKEAEKKAYINLELALQEKTLGNEAYQKGDFPTAIKHYTGAIKRNPDYAKLYNNRAACYAKLMEFRYAIEDSDKCIKLDPTFIEGYLRKGRACLGLHDGSRALMAFEEALRLDPNSAEATEGLDLATAALDKDPNKATRKRTFSTTFQHDAHASLLDQANLVVPTIASLPPTQSPRRSVGCQTEPFVTDRAASALSIQPSPMFTPNPSENGRRAAHHMVALRLLRQHSGKKKRRRLLSVSVANQKTATTTTNQKTGKTITFTNDIFGMALGRPSQPPMAGPAGGQQPLAMAGKGPHQQQPVQHQPGGHGVAPVNKFLQPIHQCDMSINDLIDEIQADPWPVAQGHRPLRWTGFHMVTADSFDSTLIKQTYQRMFEKDAHGHLKMGFNAIVEAKTSKEIRIEGALSGGASMNVLNQCVSDNEMGLGGTCQWKFCSLTARSTFLHCRKWRTSMKHPFRKEGG